MFRKIKKAFGNKMENKMGEEVKVLQDFYYSIVAPKKFRAKSDFTFNFTIHETKHELAEAIVLRVSIEDANDKNGMKLSQDVTMKPNVTEVVSIAVGDVPPEKDYKLVVKGISGVTIEKEVALGLLIQTHAILIQTDKAIYKPKDCIKFRILVLDSELKAAPINNNELHIDITDPGRNLLKKWNGVNTTNGMFSDEFQLSDLPNLGEWKITATVGDQDKSTVIEVAEYVLPKFEIEIDSPDDFTLEDQKAHIVVRAKYTSGKPLRGTAVVTIEDDNYYGYCGDNESNNKDLVKKTVIIDGKETIEFDIEQELKFGDNKKNKHFNVKYFNVKAEVTETLTGLSQSTQKSFKVHKNTYDISTSLNEEQIKKDSTVKATISVRRINGSALKFTDENDKKITVTREQFYDGKKRGIENESVHELNEKGETVLMLDIAKNESKFSLKVNYRSEKADLGTFYVCDNNEETGEEKVDLSAKVLTEKCSINNKIDVEVMSSYPIPSYTYLIVARGKILEAKTVMPTFDADVSEFVDRFSFLPNIKYAPEATILVYCVRNGEIVSTNLSVELRDDFENFIDLTVSSDMTKPGDIVDIQVKSNSSSFIGLLGIDQSVLILRDGNDLTRDEIWSELSSFQYKVKEKSENRYGEMLCGLPYYNNPWRDFSYAGLITFSNVFIPPSPVFKYRCMAMSSPMPMLMACDSSPGTFKLRPRSRSRSLGNAEAVVKPTIRKDFPETWIWDSIESKSFDGLLNFKKKVPDSLTTWILTGFSINPVTGLGITKTPLKLCVQQQFLVSLNLPYSVKRGEVLTIPCSVFNYLQNDIEAEVTLENEHNEFDFVDAAVDETIYPEIMKVQYRKKKLTVRSEDAVNAFFTIRPTKVGVISLKVSALSSTASDCVVKTLNVECDGVPQFVNKAVFIDLRDKSQIDPLDLTIDFPDTALPDSHRIEISCVGDLLGGTIKNLQQLIRLPYGCGEQNMLNFVPNIVVLNYLKNTLQLTDEIEAKAKKFMEIGYQRELSYKHKDGSFSAFGESDKMGSTWLTAFVARSFQQASDHILIGNDIVDEALKWLSGMQSSDGSFKEKGNVFHKEMQSGSSDGVALTAYVLTAFLVNKNPNSTHKKTIERAIKNITESVKSCSDVYALAVCAYALQLVGHESKKEVVSRLIELAQSNDNHKWWDKSIELKEYYYKESKTLNVEVTAYTLLTLLQSVENDSELLPIVKWLLNQRNDQGGFEGTQDTIVGIEALAHFAVKIANKESNVKIGVSASNDTKCSFDVNKDNSLVLQSQKLPSDVKSVRIDATGRGFALLELACRYNITSPDAQPAFELKPNVKLLNDDHMSLQITSSYQPPKGKDADKQSNMVVLEIELPSGFVVNTELLNALKTTLPSIKRIETKNHDSVAVIYFDYLTLEPVNLNIDGFREHIVEERKPASIFIYDYYDNALSARELYTLENVDN